MQLAIDTWSIVSNLVSITEQSEVFMAHLVFSLQFTVYSLQFTVSVAYSISCVLLKLIFQQISLTEWNRSYSTAIEITSSSRLGIVRPTYLAGLYVPLRLGKAWRINYQAILPALLWPLSAVSFHHFLSDQLVHGWIGSNHFWLISTISTSCK